MSFQGAIVTPNALIVNVDNKVYNVQSDHPNVSRLRDAYKAGNVQEFLDAYDVKKAVETYIEGNEAKSSGVSIVDDEVLYNGEPVHNSVVVAIQRMLADGFEINPMVKFLENLMECPSYNSVKEMWDFIEQMGLTITDDGCFLAYKAVRSDYTDKHTGSIDNTPGQNPKRMARSQVDDNCNNACSHGYHVGALSYAGPNGWFYSAGDHVLICKVNPKDVVSVPRDSACQKLRCCYYEPVGEFEGELKSPVYSGAVGTDYSTGFTGINRVRSECVDEYDLLEGNCYIGQYTKSDGITSTRYFMVDCAQSSENYYTVELMAPELNAGEYRTFRMARLNQVKTWDGETDPEDVPNPYPHFEDEDEELCDYCGDPLSECDGDCENDWDNGCDCAECQGYDEDDDDCGTQSYW